MGIEPTADATAQKVKLPTELWEPSSSNRIKLKLNSFPSLRRLNRNDYEFNKDQSSLPNNTLALPSGVPSYFKVKSSR